MTTDELLVRHGLTRADCPEKYQFISGYHVRNCPDLALKNFGDTSLSYYPDGDSYLVKRREAIHGTDGR